MKNQNDLIAIIVAAVLAVGASAYFVFARRQPSKPPEPTQVPVSASKVPAGAVSYANSLPGGGGGAGGIGRGGAPGATGGNKWANMGMAGPGAPNRPAGVMGVGK